MNGKIRLQLQWFAENPINYEAEDNLSTEQLENLENRILFVESNLLPLTNEEAKILINFIKSPLYDTWSIYMYAIASAPAWPFNDFLLLKDTIENQALMDIKSEAITEGAYIEHDPHFPAHINDISNNVNKYLCAIKGSLNVEELSFIVLLISKYFAHLEFETKAKLKQLLYVNSNEKFLSMARNNKIFTPEVTKFLLESMTV